MPTKVLFICTANKLRSKTAEEVFKTHNHLAVKSAGTASTASTLVSAELLKWADLVLVMEKGTATG